MADDESEQKDIGGEYGDSQRPPFKRYKRDESSDPTNPNPSIVVHVRNLHPKATEADLIEALSHFGPVAYATSMPNKRMALVEFEDMESARKCVVYAQGAQINVAGFPALFNYSTSQMIQRVGLECELPNKVLVLAVYNAQHPITVETINQICSPHGTVLRIAIIKRALLQVLVEFDSVESAKKAKHAMNGADIYSGCCTLKVEFARSDHVKVSRNDNEQWDYTVNQDSQASQSNSQRRALLTDPPPTEQSSHNPQQQFVVAAGGGAPHDSNPYQPVYAPYPVPARQVGSALGGQLPPGAATVVVVQSAGQGDGGGGGVQGRYQHPADYQVSYAGGSGGGTVGRPHMSAMESGFLYDNALVRQQSQQQQQYRGEDSWAGPPGRVHSCVLMIYGVNHFKFNCDKIFNLLCCYGNCLKVKFMRVKQDTCMAEMNNSREVTAAMRNLQNLKVFGSTLSLRASKQPNLRDLHEPFDMPDGSTSFEDYARSRNHRFTTPEAAARNRVVPPSESLWFSAPPGTTEERMKKIFEDKGAKVPEKVTIFNTRSERSTTGLAEFATKEDAAEALMVTNHAAIRESEERYPYILRLSFGGGR